MSVSLGARVLLVAVTAAVAVASPGPAQPGVGISTPSFGAPIDSTHPGYDPVTHRLQVYGAAAGFANPAAFGVAVWFEGRAAVSLSTQLTPNGTLLWQAIVDMGDADNTVLKSILAELVHLPSSRVVSREQIPIYDKRQHPDAQTHRVARGIADSLGFQITPQGVVKLGRPHTSSLPYPDLASFNADLTSTAAGFRSDVQPSAGRYLGCFPLIDEQAIFTATQAYGDVYSEADDLHDAYLVAKGVVETGMLAPPWTLLGAAAAQEYIDSTCVIKEPAPADFDVCIGELQGELERLTIGGVEAATLELGGGAHDLESDVTLEELEGIVDGFLRDLWIRWNKNGTGPVCLGITRPKVRIDSAEFSALPSLDTWSTCQDLVATADLALGQDLPFSYDVDAGDTERIELQRSAPSTFQLSGKTKVADKGSCSLDILHSPDDGIPDNDYVELLLGQFYGHMTSALEQTWDAEPQQVYVLDRLFDRLEHGVVAPQPTDHELASSLQYVHQQVPIDGMHGLFDTDVAILSTHRVGGVPDRWFYPPPGMTPIPFSHDDLSEDFFGQPFDVGFVATTGGLDQVLRELSASAWLNFALTWDDLGLPPPVGQAASDEALLDAQAAEGLHPGLQGLGTSTVRIEGRPALAPIVWMPPDPAVPVGQQAVVGRAPMAYELEHFLLEIVEPGGGLGGADRTWLQAAVGFTERDFSLELDPQPGAGFLRTSFGTAPGLFDLTILQSRFQGCVPRPNSAQFAGSCERQLEAALLALVQPRLERSLLAMPASYPAPQWWNADGLTTAPLHVEPTDKYQWEQVLFFYANLPEE